MMWKFPADPPMSDAQAANWTDIRVRGRRRYVLISGALARGIPFAIVFSIVKHLFFAGPAPFWGTLAISLVVFPIGCAFEARRLWSANERRYLALRSR